MEQPQQKVKPCCVCKEEKAKRDECLLLYGVDSKMCEPIVNDFKVCMQGYGFTAGPSA